MDIYFKGYGFWFTENEPGEPVNKLTASYLAEGVFSLSETDGIQFHHTKKIDDIYTLCSSTHKDDEFSKGVKAQLRGYNPKRCWFCIDKDMEASTGIKPIARIAALDSPNGVLENGKFAANKQQTEAVGDDGADNTGDFFKENPIEPETVFEHIKPVISIDDLIGTPIHGLFIKSRVNSQFDWGNLCVLWVKELTKEIARLRKSAFSDEAPRVIQIQQIQSKIQEIRSYKPCIVVDDERRQWEDEQRAKLDKADEAKTTRFWEQYEGQTAADDDCNSPIPQAADDGAGSQADKKRAKNDPDRDKDYLAFEKEIGREKIDRMKTPEIINLLIDRNSTLWSTSKYHAWHSTQKVVSNKTPGVRPRGEKAK